MNARRMGSVLKKYSVHWGLTGVLLLGWTGLAVAQNTMSAGSVSGTAGQTAAVPISLSLSSGTNVAFFGVTFTVVAQGSATAVTTTMTYTEGAGIPAPDLKSPLASQGKLAVGYVGVTIDPPLTGNVALGTLG